MSAAGWMTMHSYSQDRSVTKQRLTRGTLRRIGGYARPYLKQLILVLALVGVSAGIMSMTPLLLKVIIDNGIIPKRLDVIVWLAVAVGVLAVADSVSSFVQRWISARVGEGLIRDLRAQVFDHVQRMPLAFFTRTQTGALVSRLNNDVIGAQRALTGTLQSVVSNVISLAVVLVTMFVLSWQITLLALVLVPLFVIAARVVGRKLQRATRQQMVLDAEMSSMMTERFNVAGAMLTKLYGRPAQESAEFSERASKVRDIGVQTAIYSQVFFVALTLIAALATAVVYGLGGSMVLTNALQLGTLVALATLLTRLYGPLSALSNVHVDVMTALVSFDRVFEVLDLRPSIGERVHARELPAGPAKLEFDDVTFSYPAAADVSLASLESVARKDEEPATEVLHDISFSVEPGQMVALVGSSGAGKTTISHLLSRLYDPNSGAVRINGVDLRDATQDSVRDTIGVVTQDAHLFHDTIRANLLFAKPDATEAELESALRAAHIFDLIVSLPNGLDTIVGDRGYRMSGGEKQRLAIARLLLKSPSLVLLDEATAHLDSESEAAVQRALAAALAGRTSLVIAHRLATIREADHILVLDSGRVIEEGTHESLLAAGGAYAELYHTQFAHQADSPAPVG